MVANGKSIQKKRGVLIAASPTGLKLEGIGYPDNSCALAIDDLQSKMKLHDGDEEHKDAYYVDRAQQAGSVTQG